MSISQKIATQLFVCPFPGLVLCYRYLDWGLVQQGPGRAAVPSLTLFDLKILFEDTNSYFWLIEVWRILEKTTRRKKIGLFLKTKLNITQVPANAVLCVTQQLSKTIEFSELKFTDDSIWNKRLRNYYPSSNI